MLRLWGVSKLILPARPSLQRWMSSVAAGPSIANDKTSMNAESGQLKSMWSKILQFSSEVQKSQLIAKEFKTKSDKKVSTAKAPEMIIEQLFAHIEHMRRKFPDCDLSAEHRIALTLLGSLDAEAFGRVRPELVANHLILMMPANISDQEISQKVSDLLNKILRIFLAKKEDSGATRMLVKLTTVPDVFSKCSWDAGLSIQALEIVLGQKHQMKVDVEAVLYGFASSNTKLSQADAQKFKGLVDAHLLRTGWSERLAVLLFHKGLLSFRLFKFWLLEVHKMTPETPIASLSAEQKENLGLQGPHHFTDLLVANDLYFLTFADLPRELQEIAHKKAVASGKFTPWLSTSLGTPLISSGWNSGNFSKAVEKFISSQHGQLGPAVFEARIKRGQDVTSIRADILMLMYNNPKGDFIKTMRIQDLLGLVHTSCELLGCKEATQYWKQHIELLKPRMEKIHEDFGAMLESSYMLFSSPFLIRNVYGEYLKSLQTFLETQLAPQHMEDTKYKAWKRAFSEVAYLSDTLLALADKIGTESDTSEFIGHQMHVSKIISDALIDPIMYPEFENDLDRFYVLNADDEKLAVPTAKKETVNSRMSESARLRKSQLSPSGKKAEVEYKTRATDLQETEALWKEFERVVRVNHDFLANWDETTLNVFIATVKRMVKSGMATKKFVISSIRVFEHFLPKLSSTQTVELIRLLTDVNYLTEEMKEKVEEVLKIKMRSELPAQLKSSLTKTKYYEAMVDISYFCVLNKFYNQEMWNSLIYALDITGLESTLGDLSNLTQIKLGHVVLLTRMEASYIRTATLDRLMPYLTGLSQIEFDLFKPSKFSEDVGNLLHKYYYDYIKRDELAELFKVHYLQEKHVILCLDHEHFLVNSGICKGQVATSIRLLKGLGFEVHIISRRRYKYDEKRSVRLDYLRENLKGVNINETRKLEVETSPAHGY